MSAKILVVDDEPDALELIEFNLKGAGFDVGTAVDGEEALRKARSFEPSLIILDVMLPEVDGFEVCKTLKKDPKTSRIPIIMVTAKAAEIDRVLGLELGADDYVTKPFSPRELVLRVKSMLRRTSEPEPETPERLQIGKLVIDHARHEILVNNRLLDLTATEFKLISVLAQRKGRVQSRDQLLRDVWEYDSMIDTRTVDTHIRRVREKLGKAADCIETIRGVGYRMV